MGNFIKNHFFYTLVTRASASYGEARQGHPLAAEFRLAAAA
jgi:hypothetical protein